MAHLRKPLEVLVVMLNARHLEHTCPDGQGGQLPFHIAHPDTSTTSVPQTVLWWVRPSVQPRVGRTRFVSQLASVSLALRN